MNLKEILTEGVLIVILLAGLALVLSGLSGCAPLPERPSLFETPCGMRLVGPIPEPDAQVWTFMNGKMGFNEADISNLETRVLVTFAQMVRGDARFSNVTDTCNLLKGWTLQVNAKPSWLVGNQRFAGLTWCDARTLEIGNVPPDRGAYAHELAHVIQDCNSGFLTDIAHGGWEERGINAACLHVRSL